MQGRTSPRPLPPGTVQVLCHQCGTMHPSSDIADSTVCPGCGARIVFDDVVVGRFRSTPVDTRGDLLVERRGYLFSTMSCCRNATILGGINGLLVCEGRLVFYSSGRHAVRLRAEQILIPGGTTFECPFPLEAGELTVRGKLIASVLVRGNLKLLRGGMIDGTVFARSIQVDCGAHLLGKLHITTAPQPEIRKPASRPKLTNLQVARGPRTLSRKNLI